MPGFNKSRIVGLTDQELDEFTCAICLAIFINPMVTQCCRQTYCNDCIKEWVSEYKTCPNDRKTLTMRGLRPVPRVMNNLLDNMKIKCDYETDGCPQVVKMWGLSEHLAVCDYRPNQLCKICGLIRGFVSTHNCIQSLIAEKEKTDAKYLNFSEENSCLLSKVQENERIISKLRKDHLVFVEELKSKHLKDIDQIEGSYTRAFEDLRKSHQNKSDILIKSYDDLKVIVSNLESKILEYDTKLNESDHKCRSVEKTNEELTEELNSVVHKLRLKHSRNVKKLKTCYARLFNKETKGYKNELVNLKKTCTKQNTVVSNLEFQLSEYNSKLDVSVDKCRTLEIAKEELIKELNSIKNSIGEILSTQIISLEISLLKRVLKV